MRHGIRITQEPDVGTFARPVASARELMVKVADLGSLWFNRILVADE